MLEELDWKAYRAKYGNIQRLDRILRAEGDDPNRYKVTKQADTGIEIREGMLRFTPRLPDQISEVSFTMQFRGASLEVGLSHERLRVAARSDSLNSPTTVAVGDEARQLGRGQETSFELAALPF